LAGKSKLARIRLREKIEEIKEINWLFDKKIQVVLLCKDSFEWMNQ
jgi:hypothetical protein